MANTSSRTLRLLSLLQTHRFWPGVELASRLDVSDRTLRRDVERLRELGYPVTSSRGVEGGYQLGSGGSMPPLVVDEDEAIAMVVALGQTASAQSGALADSTLSALSKVVQVLPARLRRRAEALRAATVDSPFSEAPEVEASVLGAIAQAIRDAERVRFSYTARGGASAGELARRHVEPHQLVTVGRRWYLLAFDLERQDSAHWFRLDRLRDPMGRGPSSDPARSRQDAAGTCATASPVATASSGSPSRSPPPEHVRGTDRPVGARFVEVDGGTIISASTRTTSLGRLRDRLPRHRPSSRRPEDWRARTGPPGSQHRQGHHIVPTRTVRTSRYLTGGTGPRRLPSCSTSVRDRRIEYRR